MQLPSGLRPLERDVQRLPRARRSACRSSSPRRRTYTFDGPGANEDFGREQVTGNPADRYAFRTSPLRNVTLQPAFMHDGAFTASRRRSATTSTWSPRRSSYDPRLEGRRRPRRPIAPVAPILARSTRWSRPHASSRRRNLDALMAFVGKGLLDPRASPERLHRLMPERLPSGRTPLQFEFPSR